MARPRTLPLVLLAASALATLCASSVTAEPPRPTPAAREDLLVVAFDPAEGKDTLAALRVDGRTLAPRGRVTIALHAGGVSRPALRELALLCEGARLVGHELHRLRPRLEEAYRKAALPEPRWVEPEVDTAVLAWPLYASGEVKSLSLAGLAEHFGILARTDGTAEGAAERTLSVYRRLMGRVAPLRAAPVVAEVKPRPRKVPKGGGTQIATIRSVTRMRPLLR